MTAQTSEHGGLIYGLASEGDGAGEPVSAAVTRDHVINGLLHQLDSMGQVIVNCAVASSSEIEQSSPPTDEPSLMFGCDFRFPLRIRHGDESSFRLVVKLRGGLSAAGTATYRLTLRPVDRAVYSRPVDPAASAFAPTNIVEVSTSTPGGEDLEAFLYLTPAQVRRAPYTAVQSLDGSGSPMWAFYIQAAFQVWAMSSSGSASPRILSLTAIEYPGER